MDITFFKSILNILNIFIIYEINSKCMDDRSTFVSPGRRKKTNAGKCS